jgi:hypothetical protein
MDPSLAATLRHIAVPGLEERTTASEPVYYLQRVSPDADPLREEYHQQQPEETDTESSVDESEGASDSEGSQSSHPRDEKDEKMTTNRAKNDTVDRNAQHPSLTPPIGMAIFQQDVSSLTQAQRATLYTPALRSRDEEIVSTYTDPIELDLVLCDPRFLEGRYYERENLYALYERGLERGFVINPLNRNCAWTVENVYNAMTGELSKYDRECISGALLEYNSRFHIRDAWEERR